MTFGIAEMYVMIAVTFILILYLKHDSARYAETQNITRLDNGDDHDRREYIASGITDGDFHGTKILVILYSLYCRKCGSTNIYAEIAETKEHIQIECRDCGYVTLIPLKKLIIHEELVDDVTKSDEELAREYVKKLRENHEVDVVEPEKPHKQD